MLGNAQAYGRKKEMMSRRGFGACVICSAIGLTASGVDAQTPNVQTAGLTRTVVNQTELPGGTHVSSR
jgi:hypothetical protein